MTPFLVHAFLCIFLILIDFNSANRCNINIDKINNPEIGLSTVDLIVAFGYPVQTFNLITPDGYIVNLVRIPYGKNSNHSYNQPKPVVLIMHGMTSTTDEFIYMGVNHSLPLYLSDLGYDVWMGNARGTKYSLGHITLNSEKFEFWNFSFHEISLYDVPTFIDKALEVTGQSSLYFIGHSQGGTAFYALTSMKPEYRKKIKIGIALAPAVFLTGMNLPSRLIATYSDIPYKILQALGIGEALPTNEVMNLAGQLFCRNGTLTNKLCADVFFLLFGYDPEQLNYAKIPLIFSNVPGGASIKQFIHFAQIVKTGHFALFDYGATENLKRYGTKIPPDYPLNKITTPNAIIYGENDQTTTVNDMILLRKAVSSVVEFYKVPYAKFNHIDFLFAKDAVSLVYKKIDSIMKQYK